jgi:hypothetical protein
MSKWVMRTHFRHLCSKNFLMGFDPCNRSLKIRKSIESPSGVQLSKCEFIWECECSFSHTLLHCQLSIAGNVTLGLHCWSAPLQALVLVASPRLGLRYSLCDNMCNCNLVVSITIDEWNGCLA